MPTVLTPIKCVWNGDVSIPPSCKQDRIREQNRHTDRQDKRKDCSIALWPPITGKGHNNSSSHFNIRNKDYTGHSTVSDLWSRETMTYSHRALTGTFSPHLKHLRNQLTHDNNNQTTNHVTTSTDLYYNTDSTSATTGVKLSQQVTVTKFSINSNWQLSNCSHQIQPVVWCCYLVVISEPSATTARAWHYPYPQNRKHVTYCNALEKDHAMAKGDKGCKYDDVWTHGFWDMFADRHSSIYSTPPTSSKVNTHLDDVYRWQSTFSECVY